MREDKASYTAEITALCRAIESAKPENERICYDPVAKDFLSASFLSCRRSGRSPASLSASPWTGNGPVIWAP